MSTTRQEPGSQVPTFELRHRLHRALEHGGVRVSEMAAYLEVSESTMTNYLSGRTRPRAGSLRAWAIRCGVPFDWLATGDGHPFDGTSPDPAGGPREGTRGSAWNVPAARVVLFPLAS